jgi:hypothetical protein
VGTKNTLIATLVVVTALAGGCSTTVTGAAQQVPGLTPVKKPVDPCTLLDTAQARALNLDPQGKFVANNPGRLSPQNCTWNPDDIDEDGNPLTVVWSEDLSLDVYNNGAQAAEKVTLGGLEWTRYPGIVGDSYCSLSTPLGPKSFVELSTINTGDSSKACDLAKLAAPLVASHLPGGDPSPTLPEPSKAPVATGPLASIQPCALLKPDQVTSLKLSGAGSPISQTSLVPPGCEWNDTDGDGGQKPFDVFVDATRAAKDWPGTEDVSADPEPVDVGDKHWIVYKDGPICSAILGVTDSSSLKTTSGQLADPSKACDLVKAAIPLMTANIPAS